MCRCRYARAAADVSDGLLADAGHLARASGLKAAIRLEELPLSIGAADWLSDQDDEASSRRDLATGGDDYAIVCAVAAREEADFRTAATAAGDTLSSAATSTSTPRSARAYGWRGATRPSCSSAIFRTHRR